VRIDPNTRACVLELLPGSLFFVSGGVHAQLLPQANPSGRPELRVVTTQGSLLLGSGAEIWVSGRSWLERGRAGDEVSSQTYLAVLRGQAELGHAEAIVPRAIPNDGAAAFLGVVRVAQGRELDVLEAGRELAFGMPLEARSPQSVGEARLAGEQALRRRRTPIRLANGDGLLEAGLQSVLTGQKTGASLLARLPRTRDPAAAEEIRAYQRDLAEHAQRRLEARQVLRLALERSLIGVLAVCSQQAEGIAECPVFGVWRQRYEGRVREALSGH
jgi:hypothetical protein